VRLHRRDPRIRFAGRVRESLIASLQLIGWSIEGLPYRIQRSAREHDAVRKRGKARRNIRIAEREIRERGPQSHLLNCLGDAAQSLEENEHAAHFFQQAIDAAEPGSIDMLEGYYGLLTSLDGKPENCQRQLELALRAAEMFPLDAQLLCALGGYLQALGHIELAQQSYETAFRYGQIHPTVWHVAEVRDIAAICWSITLQLQGKLDRAQQVLEEALSAERASTRVRRYLIDLLVRQAKRDEALAASRKLPRETPHLEPLRSAIRGACLAVEKNWIAAKAYLRTAYEAGCRDVLCLRWYAVVLLAEGRADQARDVLQIWQRFDPHHPELQKLNRAVAEAPQGRQIRIDDAESPAPAAPALPSSESHRGSPTQQ
jgi:tetratricopeptide (TPR) repeat protein